jgi:hypothetical protein
MKVFPKEWVVSALQAEQVIETRKPLGMFILQEGVGWTAIDNSQGNAWTEHFRTQDEAVLWLRHPDIFGVPIYKDGYAQLIYGGD